MLQTGILKQVACFHKYSITGQRMKLLKFNNSLSALCKADFLKWSAGAGNQFHSHTHTLRHSTHSHTQTHRSYTESNDKRCEVGRKQTEGHFNIVNEAIFHVTVGCVLHKSTAVWGIEVHHKVTLETQRDIMNLQSNWSGFLYMLLQALELEPFNILFTDPSQCLLPPQKLYPILHNTYT